MNFDQIKRALIAKTKDKSNMPDWYYKRLEKCIGCEFNSGNSEKLSLKDRLRISHNFGKDACLKCTCGVEDKSSDPAESCPEGFWGKEGNIPSNILNIKTKSKKVNLHYSKSTEKYVIDYGIIPYNYKSDVRLFIKENNLNNIRVSTTCGCTVANIVKTNEGAEMEVKYDTLRIGTFTKNITMHYSKNNKAGQIIITIKGEVTKTK